MANFFKNLLDKIFGPDPEPEPPLSPEDMAAAEYFMFEIFAQQKATAWKPVGSVLFSPRLRRRNPLAHHMGQAMDSMFSKGWVETKNVRFLVMTDSGYAQMLALGIKPAQ
jgi:hypothetical protein